MHFSTILPVSILFSIAAAQASSSAQVAAGASVCAAQPVLEACLASTEAIATACSSNDYNCLCEKWSDVLTCFLQCPNDPRQPSRLSNKETYCANASVYTSSVTKAISRSVEPVSASATATDSAAADAKATGSASATNTKSSSASSTPNSAAKRELVGGLAVGVMGLFGALL